jgi:hypothetical protein
MAWDSKRPVRWRRLLTEWAVVMAFMLILTTFFSSNRTTGSYVAVLVGGSVYPLFGWVLAKFGYQRATFKEQRERSLAAAQAKRAAKSPGGVPTRAKPAPTRRTSTGPSQRPKKARR